MTHYVYDEKARLIGEYNATGQANQETVYLFGQPIAVLKGADIYAVHTDHLSSPRKITNPSGNTVWQWQDKPFGDSPVNPDPDGDGVAFEYNLRFPGQYYDAETGLHYNYHRYYDPQIGRFLTSDPIGLAGGLNAYTYVDGNPVNFIDPLGLDAIYINYDYYPVTTPFGKLPRGHGAVVSVDPSSGNTKYYELGRYGDDNGIIRRGKIPNISLGDDGLPTEDSLNHLYDFLSHNFGHDVHVTGTYYPNSDYKGTINFAEQFKRQHPKYDLLNNNCKTFGKAAVTAYQEGSSCK